MTDGQRQHRKPQARDARAARAWHAQFWRQWWWAVLGGGAVLAGIVAAFILGTGSAPVLHGLVRPASVHAGGARVPGQAGAVSPAVASAPAAIAAASTPAGKTSPAAPGLPHVPSRVKASLTRWGAGPGGAALTVVSRQLGESAQAGGVRLYLAMQQACTQLAQAVKVAAAGPPIPEPAMQRRYAQALATLAAAADHCQAGISAKPSGEGATAQVDQAMIQRSKLELAAGARELYLATSQIRMTSAGGRR